MRGEVCDNVCGWWRLANGWGDHLEAQLERECKHLREQKEKQHLEWKNSSQQHKQMVQAEYDKKVCLVVII